MLNISITGEDAYDISSYNDAYQKMASICFETINPKNIVFHILLILQKKLVFIAKNTAIFTQYPVEFVDAINQLNQIVKSYNHTCPNSPITLLPLPPRPQLFGQIPTPLKSITQPADLGVPPDWSVAVLKTLSISTGIACNLLGVTAGRYGMQAANTLLQHTVAEVMVQDMLGNAVKAAALGSLNGAALVAPLIGGNTLLMDAEKQKLCERNLTELYENEESESEWDQVETAIQLILSTTSQLFLQKEDLISVCLFDDLYALNSWHSLLIQETYDDSEVLAVVQTLEYLTYYFTIFDPQAKQILHEMITIHYVHFFEASEYASRLQAIQTCCEPESLLGKVAEYATRMIAFPGYSLIDWSRLQQLRANPPKELLEKLAEIRQYNKDTITNLHAMYCKQYHIKLLSLYSAREIDEATDLALSQRMNELSLVSSTVAIVPLLQEFSFILSIERRASNNTPSTNLESTKKSTI